MKYQLVRACATGACTRVILDLDFLWEGPGAMMWAMIRSCRFDVHCLVPLGDLFGQVMPSKNPRASLYLSLVDVLAPFLNIL
jgi:hypothetical protein